MTRPRLVRRVRSHFFRPFRVVTIVGSTRLVHFMVFYVVFVQTWFCANLLSNGLCLISRVERLLCEGLASVLYRGRAEGSVGFRNFPIIFQRYVGHGICYSSCASSWSLSSTGGACFPSECPVCPFSAACPFVFYLLPFFCFPFFLIRSDVSCSISSG